VSNRSQLATTEQCRILRWPSWTNTFRVRQRLWRIDENRCCDTPKLWCCVDRNQCTNAAFSGAILNTIVYFFRAGALLGLGGRITDKDRVVGSAKQIKGAVKQVVGKAVGDAKLESEGNADKIEGTVQNAIGGLKATLKGK
jgi:uncharacterized protein YjbJ (UPF0337 family)